MYHWEMLQRDCWHTNWEGNLGTACCYLLNKCWIYDYICQKCGRMSMSMTVKINMLIAIHKTNIKVSVLVCMACQGMCQASVQRIVTLQQVAKYIMIKNECLSMQNSAQQNIQDRFLHKGPGNSSLQAIYVKHTYCLRNIYHSLTSTGRC